MAGQTITDTSSVQVGHGTDDGAYVAISGG
jgi:hypothetical protein